MTTDEKYNVTDLLDEIKNLRKQVAELNKSTVNSPGNSLYKNLFDDALPYQSLDENGNIIAINKPWLELFNYSFEEVVGTPVKNFLSSNSQTIFNHQFLHFKEKGLVHNVEFEFIAKSGKIVPVIVNGKIQTDNNNQFKAIHCFLNDISWRKEAEEEIRIFMESVDNSSDAIGMSTPEGKHFYQNKAFDKLFGYVGKNPPETVYVDTKIGVEVFNTIMSGDQWSGEVKMYAQDGSILNILLRAYASKDTNGRIKALVGVHTDITKRKQAELALQRSESEYKETSMFLETLFNVIPDIIGVQDANHNVIRYNEAGYNFFNKTHENVVGKKCFELMGEDIQCKTCATMETYRTKKPAHTESYLPEMDLFLDFYSYPILDENGNIKQIIEHLRDNTARKKAEKELIRAKERAEESDKLKSAFLANLSHELRTPMNGILGFSNLLKNPELTSEKRDNYINIIRKSGNHLLSIIHDIIEISKIETRQIKPHFTNVDIKSLISDLYEVIKLSIPDDKNINLKVTNNSADLVNLIVTDEVKLKQVLTNLLTNAIKYTEKGYVHFGYELKNGIRFFVEDTGKGIDKKNHQIIFDRFRQIENDITSKKEGSGLGLAISKAYIEMLGGSITLESEPGKGSVFSFTLPYVIPKNNVMNSLPYDNKTTIDTNDNVHILIAEDDEYNYIYFSELLSDDKYQLVRANNGREAVDICKENSSIQLVLMDLKMPVMNGYEAFRQIRKLKPDLPVIAQTAYALSDDEKIIQETGFTGYITKPIVESKLFELLDNVLKKKDEW